MSERVLCAMSGGVDSSVAAALLRDSGHDVVGVTLHLWDYPDDGSVRGRCCAPEDVHDARQVANHLGIPHYTFDRREHFRSAVVEPFVSAYLTGTTPSPCVACNRSIKVPELLHLADRLEARWVATGHYARVDRSGETPRLLRAVDATKDQSYFLHAATAAQLRHLMFPLGERTKSEVRRLATELRLPGADKGESQELCFVPSGRYDALVEAEAAHRLRPGPLVDESGRVVGRHDGVHRFTVGQRRNLGVSLGQRAYVTAIDAARGEVELGSAERLAARGAVLKDVTLAASVGLPLSCDVAVRYRGEPRRASVIEQDGSVEVHFHAAARAVVPGQVAVFYDGDRVLGGGTIARSLPFTVPAQSGVLA